MATVYKTVQELLDKLESEDLDDFVHEAKGQEAADINNGGLQDQVDYLIGWFGSEEALIKALQEEEVLK